MSQVKLMSQMAFVVALATLVAGCGESEAPVRDTDPILLTFHAEPGEAGWQALITGTLAINSEGCFAVNDRPMIARDTWEVTSTGDGVRMPDGTEVKVGDSIEWAGGVRHYHAGDEIPVDRRACVDDPDARPVDFVVVNPEIDQ